MSKPNIRAKKLLTEVNEVVDKSDPPAFYRNSHCPQCHLKDVCFKKLKERDCISLLGGMSPKSLVKYHKKGIFSILQLSHLFKPRRRGRSLHRSGTFPFELKSSLPSASKKTYVLHKPDLAEHSVSIYIDFEGTDFIYLLGVLVSLDDEPDEAIVPIGQPPKTRSNTFLKISSIYS